MRERHDTTMTRRPLGSWAGLLLAISLGACAWLVSTPSVRAAYEKEASGSAESDLDAQLLEDLGGDLFDDEAVPPQETGSEPPSTADESGADEPGNLDQDLLESLGEDIGRSSAADDPHAPLERIGMRMRSVQRLLAERDATGRATSVQDQIVADLEALIEQMKRQEKRSQQGGKPSPGSRRSDARPQGGQPGKASAEGPQPAADSTDELREGSSEGASTDRRSVQQELLKNLWGHLPERAREQMLQSSDDEFLPKYELDIEQYFRRLAEDPDLDGP